MKYDQPSPLPTAAILILVAAVLVATRSSAGIAWHWGIIANYSVAGFLSGFFERMGMWSGRTAPLDVTVITLPTVFLIRGLVPAAWDDNRALVHLTAGISLITVLSSFAGVQVRRRFLSPPSPASSSTPR